MSMDVREKGTWDLAKLPVIVIWISTLVENAEGVEFFDKCFSRENKILRDFFARSEN